MTALLEAALLPALQLSEGNAHQTHIAGRHNAKRIHSRLHLLAHIYIHLS